MVKPLLTLANPRDVPPAMLLMGPNGERVMDLARDTLAAAGVRYYANDWYVLERRQFLPGLNPAADDDPLRRTDHPQLYQACPWGLDISGDLHVLLAWSVDHQFVLTLEGGVKPRSSFIGHYPPIRSEGA